jgi:hypothetical protein
MTLFIVVIWFGSASPQSLSPSTPLVRNDLVRTAE